MWFCLWIVFSLLDSSEEQAVIGNYGFSMSSCGLKALQPIPLYVSSRMSGTVEAKEGDAPWMALIQVFESQVSINFCGGAVIADQFVLTSSHCVLNNYTKLVVLGSATDNSTYDVLYVIPNGDLALLKTSTKIIVRSDSTFSHYVVNGVCVPQKDITNEREENATITSYGFSETANTNVLYTLRSKQLEIHSNANCTSDQICVDNQNLICYGDTGSPLIQTDLNESRAVLIGVAQSHNQTQHGCGPEVVYFTRVSFFVDWIQQVIEALSDDVTESDGTKQTDYYIYGETTETTTTTTTTAANTGYTTSDYHDSEPQSDGSVVSSSQYEPIQEDEPLGKDRVAIRLILFIFLVILLFIAFQLTFSFIKLQKTAKQLKKIRKNNST